MGRKAFIFKKRRHNLKTVLISVSIFILILAIAITYQMYLTDIATDFNDYAEQIQHQVTMQNFDEAEKALNNLEKLWNKNSSFLMMFHDHSLINNASVNIELAVNSFKDKHFDETVSYLIYFIATIDELTAENRPTFENIL